MDKTVLWFMNAMLAMVVAMLIMTYTKSDIIELDSLVAVRPLPSKGVKNIPPKRVKLDKEERFRRIIREACAEAGLPLSRLDETMILETLAVESDLGLTSSNASQVTKSNYTDMVDHYIRYNPEFSHLIGKDLDNLKHSIQLCRLHYIRLGLDTPKTRKGRAKLWKARYNTDLGEGKVKHYMTKAALYFDEV